MRFVGSDNAIQKMYSSLHFLHFVIKSKGNIRIKSRMNQVQISLISWLDEPVESAAGISPSPSKSRQIVPGWMVAATFAAVVLGHVYSCESTPRSVPSSGPPVAPMLRPVSVAAGDIGQRIKSFTATQAEHINAVEATPNLPASVPPHVEAISTAAAGINTQADRLPVEVAVPVNNAAAAAEGKEREIAAVRANAAQEKARGDELQIKLDSELHRRLQALSLGLIVLGVVCVGLGVWQSIPGMGVPTLGHLAIGAGAVCWAAAGAFLFFDRHQVAIEWVGFGLVVSILVGFLAWLIYTHREWFRKTRALGVIVPAIEASDASEDIKADIQAHADAQGVAPVVKSVVTAVKTKIDKATVKAVKAGAMLPEPPAEGETP